MAEPAPARTPTGMRVEPAAQGRPAGWGRRLLRTRMGLIGAILVAFICAAALLAPHLAPHNPIREFADGLSRQGAPLPPGPKFPLGTDDVGRDVLSRLVYGAQNSLEFSILASALATAIGLLLGVAAGYYGGMLDQVLMRFTDAMFAFPFLLFLMFLLSVLRSTGLGMLILVVGLAGWPTMARVARGETLVAKEKLFVEAERSLGASSLRIVIRHVVPNVLPALVVLTTLRIGGFVGLEAALSYLSLGVPPPAPSWGAMIREGQEFFQIAPWLMIYPGVMLAITVLGFNLLGDGLNAVLNPKQANG